MKKITLLFIIGLLAYNTQAQESEGLKPFQDFCKACEDGTKDYYKSNCRGVLSIRDVIADIDAVGIEKTTETIQNVVFAYKNTDEIRYGFTAKTEILNKKGEVLFTSMDGAMYYLNNAGNLGQIISTKMENFQHRSLTTGQSVLFRFPVNLEIPADAKKWKARTTVYRIDLSNRELVEVQTTTTKIK
jgi:hypothetical protein